MNKAVIFLISISMAASLALFNLWPVAKARVSHAAPKLMQTAPKNMISVTSPIFQNEGDIPSKYTCDGSNEIPELDISGVPQSAKSVAVIVDDPDAPMGTFNHWTIWNIDPMQNKITKDSLGGSTSGKNSAGKNDFVGPCPPSGTHRYFFKVYALDDKINLDPNSTRDDLVRAMENHILAQGELLGKYGR